MTIEKRGNEIQITLTENETSTMYRAFSSLNRGVFSGLTAGERELFNSIAQRLLEIK